MKMTISEIRERNQRARETMYLARQKKFAVGAFNIDNQETLVAICRAVQKKQAPAMIEVSDGEVKALGMQNIRDMVDNYSKEYGIELYLNLDHSPTVEASKQAIDLGYEFIHIDISQANKNASDEEIIEKTKEVVEYAKYTGAIVESEPHYFAGGSNVFTEAFNYDEIKNTFSTPEGAKHFVDVTGVDTFAAAVGNLHGKYPVPKQLDLELLKTIRGVIECNISLHGGSGTPGHYFEEAVKIGVNKININSDMRFAYRNALEKTLKDSPNQYAVIKLMGPVYDAVQEVVESKLDMFGAEGKARVW